MPQTESAVTRHDRMVREEREQGEAARSLAPTPDLWRGLADRFRPSARQETDPAVDVLAQFVTAEERAIDVGAGGGRLAIPLARRCREVIAVEPSPAMRAVLAEEMAAQRVENVRIVPQRWEEAKVEPVALVFAANVTYGVQAVAPFLRKLDATARRQAALVLYADPPQNALAPFWQAVYGEERLRLPCRDEALAVVRELGGEPRLLPLPAQPVQPLGPRGDALELLRRRLLIAPESAADRRLLDVFDSLAIERDGLYWPRDAEPNPRTIIAWEPGRFG